MVLQVVLCSSCSGHGFKFCSVIGEVLADLALTGNTQHPVAMHSLRPERDGFGPVMEAFRRGESKL